MDTYPTREYISIFFLEALPRIRPPETNRGVPRRLVSQAWATDWRNRSSKYEEHPVPYSLGLSEEGARLHNVARKLTRDAFKRTILITGSASRNELSVDSRREKATE